MHSDMFGMLKYLITHVYSTRRKRVKPVCSSYAIESIRTNSRRDFDLLVNKYEQGRNLSRIVEIICTAKSYVQLNQMYS